MRLEDEPWWDQLLARKDTTPLRDLAREFDVSPGLLSLAMKRTNTAKVPQGDSPVAPAPATDRPGSKDYLLKPYVDLMGSIPDREVADKAGVSVRTVAGFRARNKIKGFSGRKKAPKTGRRKSKIDAFVDKVGKLSDREVAELAGVTTNAVRNYRAARGIPSSRAYAQAQSETETEPTQQAPVMAERADRADAGVAEATVAPEGTVAPEATSVPQAESAPAVTTPASSAPPPKQATKAAKPAAAQVSEASTTAASALSPAPLSASAAATASAYGWSVQLADGVEWLVVAIDASAAVLRAAREGEVVAIRRLGPALI